MAVLLERTLVSHYEGKNWFDSAFPLVRFGLSCLTFSLTRYCTVCNVFYNLVYDSPV